MPQTKRYTNPEETTFVKKYYRKKLQASFMLIINASLILLFMIKYAYYYRWFSILFFISVAVLAILIKWHNAVRKKYEKQFNQQKFEVETLSGTYQPKVIVNEFKQLKDFSKRHFIEKYCIDNNEVIIPNLLSSKLKKGEKYSLDIVFNKNNPGEAPLVLLAKNKQQEITEAYNYQHIKTNNITASPIITAAIALVLVMVMHKDSNFDNSDYSKFKSLVKRHDVDILTIKKHHYNNTNEFLAAEHQLNSMVKIDSAVLFNPKDESYGPKKLVNTNDTLALVSALRNGVELISKRMELYQQYISYSTTIRNKINSSSRYRLEHIRSPEYQKLKKNWLATLAKMNHKKVNDFLKDTLFSLDVFLASKISMYDLHKLVRNGEYRAIRKKFEGLHSEIKKIYEQNLELKNFNNWQTNRIGDAEISTLFEAENPENEILNLFYQRAFRTEKIIGIILNGYYSRNKEVFFIEDEVLKYFDKNSRIGTFEAIHNFLYYFYILIAVITLTVILISSVFLENDKGQEYWSK